MWFMSFGSDIYVFICMGYVLVELFGEWVYGLCWWWLSKVYLWWNLGVLSYNMWYLVNLIFPLLLGLFGVSWSSKLIVLEDIVILLSWVSWWYCVNIMGASHIVGNDIEWVNFINWSLCLVIKLLRNLGSGICYWWG